MPQDIAWQNKDIISKVLAETLKDSHLRLFGLELPRIRRLLPTNLPAVELNELRIDNIYELVDDSLALVDYESEYREEDKLKYGGYLIRISIRYKKERKPYPVIHMIVIYTADVRRDQVKTVLDRDGYRIRIIPVFLSELDSEEIRERLNRKVKKGKQLTEQELMEFILLPLSYPSKEKKLEILKEQISLAEEVKDIQTSRFLAAGLVAFSDKIVDADTREEVRRLLKLTQIEKMWRDETDQLLAEKDKEIKAKDAEMQAMAATKDAEIAAKDAEAAATLVEVITTMQDRLKVSLEDVCKFAGISMERFGEALILRSKKPVPAPA